MGRTLRIARAVGFAALLAGVVGAEGGIPSSPDAVQPLAPGDRVPSVTVRAVDGSPVDLAALVRDEGALLVFYRGGW